MDLAKLKTDINFEKKRFELVIDDKIAYIDFILNTKGVMYLTHTEVPSGLEGKGVGSKIVREALTYIEENGHQLAPLCPFVASYLKRHPEFGTLLAPGFNIK